MGAVRVAGHTDTCYPFLTRAQTFCVNSMWKSDIKLQPLFSTSAADQSLLELIKMTDSKASPQAPSEVEFSREQPQGSVWGFLFCVFLNF